MPAPRQLLGSVPLFATLSKADVAAIARVGQRIMAKPGKAICIEGEPGNDFYLIVEGSATVERGGKRIRTLVAGDHFGELALLARRPRLATVVAVSDLALLRISAKNFSSLIDELPALSHKLLATLASRLRDLEESDTE